MMSTPASTAATQLVQAELLWEPAPDVRTTTHIGTYLAWLERERGLRFTGYDDLWRWSVDDLPAFWRSIWDHFGVIAHSEPSEVLVDRRMPGARWFPGATLNYAEQCLQGADDDLVIIARSQTRPAIELTRGELRDAVARAAEGLRRLGVGPGDRVAAYVPNTPEAVIALLATASLGAVWAACAPEFGTSSVLDRLGQVEPKVLIAVDGYRYGEKHVDRLADVATIRAGLPSLEATVRIPYLHDGVPAAEDGIAWADLLANPAELAHEAVAFDHPLWILFSSGTTGLPKAMVHGHGGIVLEMFKSHALHGDLGRGDRYFFVGPTGWVVWNVLVSGLLVGAAIVLMDGNPGHPDASELWRAASETQATSFGCGAAFLMLSRASGLEPGRMFGLERLRSISSTGSPLPADGFRWVYEHVKPDLYLQSMSGGTDICGAFVGGSPLLGVRAGEIACRYLGVRVDALAPDGRPVVGELGELVVSEPMPSMPVSFWNDTDGVRYRETYFDQYPGRWRHGDWIKFDPRGSCVVTGRSDATLNRGGVRLGTSEFYAVLEDVPEIADALVVHLEDAEGGLGELLLFVALGPGAQIDDDLGRSVRAELRARLSPRHVPDRIHAVPAIPYTLTGKKLEIPVKRILQGADRANVVSEGAIRDPSALEAFERFVRPRRASLPLSSTSEYGDINAHRQTPGSRPAIGRRTTAMRESDQIGADPSVVVERNGRVASVVLDRVSHRNALDPKLVRDLAAALHEVEHAADIDCVLLRGNGPGFSAGIDSDTLPLFGTVAGVREIRGAFVAAFERLERMAKPTVAQVHGFAIGAGLELALACDLRVVAADAALSLPETRMGAVPDVGGLSRLSALVGLGRAKELVMTSAMIDGTRAGQLGIANRVAAPEDLGEATAELIQELLRCSTHANGFVKQILDLAAKPAHQSVLDAELAAQLSCTAMPEFRAAAEAFAANPAANLGGPS